MSHVNHGTLEIQLSVRRHGVWKTVVKVVDSHRVLDEARKLAKRVGARELRIGGNSYEEPLPRWVWHSAGPVRILQGVSTLDRYWGVA